MSIYSLITINLRSFGIPILIIIGSILNMISFLVLKRIKSSSTAQYMSFLGIVDTLVLITGAASICLDHINLPHLFLIFGCKSTLFLFYSMADFSVFIIVIMTAERFYGVWRPVQANKTTDKNNLILILVFLFCCLVNLHLIFTHTMVKHNDYTTNTTININKTNFNVCEYVYLSEFYEQFWVYIDATIYSFIPFIVLTILNILIIICIKKAENINQKLNQVNRKSFTSTNFNKLDLVNNNMSDLNNNELKVFDGGLNPELKQTFKSEESVKLMFRNNNRLKLNNNRFKKTRLIVMLFTINIFFCLLSMPMSFLQIFYYRYVTLDSNKMYVDEKEDYLDIIDLLHTVAELLQFLNHSTNFILYSLSGKTFRNETKRYFRNIFYYLFKKNELY